MLTALLQSAMLLIVGQLILGAVGFVIPARFAWLGLPLGILLFWLIIRTARVLRAEMEAMARKRVRVAPWQMAVWAMLLWQWPSVLLLPSGTFVPSWMGQIWNGAVLPVQGTVGLFSEPAASALEPWLWAAVAMEALAFVLVVGRPLTAPAQHIKPAETARRQVAAAGDWAPARRHKDVVKRRKKG